MRRAAWMAALILGLGPLWPARADGIRSYDRVVNVGNTTFTHTPRIDEEGNIVRFAPDRGDYRVNTIMDPNQYAHTLGYALTRGDDPTNLLPDSLSSASVRLSMPNEAGHVVGYFSGSDDRAFYFAPETGQITWLKTLPGTDEKPEIFAINDHDQIVGEQGSQATFYSSPTAEPLTLINLLGTGSGWRFVQATGINGRGEIVGYGISPTEGPADFLLEPTPVPEPSTWALFALSSMVLAARSIARR